MNARHARTVLAAFAAIALAGGAAAAHRPRIEHVRTGGAWLCEGALVVRYDLERLTGREWVFVQDDGNVTVQTAPTTGRWVTLASTSGGEGIRRVPATTVPPLQAVRVVRHGIASSARLTQEGCPVL